MPTVAQALQGVGVLVTRPEQQSAPLCRLLQRYGASVYRLPAIAIVERPGQRELAAAVGDLTEFEMIIFVSANAVRFGIGLLGKRSDLIIAAIGPSTARALRHCGYRVSIVPSGGFDSEHLLKDPRLLQISGKRVLLIKGSGGLNILEQELAKRGALIKVAEVYERLPTSPGSQIMTDIERAFEAGNIQLITATSVEITHHLFSLAQGSLRKFFERATWIAPSLRITAVILSISANTPVLQSSSAQDQELVRAALAWRARLSGA